MKKYENAKSDKRNKIISWSKSSVSLDLHDVGE